MTPERATLQSIIAVMEKYDDPDDKLTIALGNFNRVEAEVHQLERQLAEKDEALRHIEAVATLEPQHGAYKILRAAREALRAEPAKDEA